MNSEEKKKLKRKGKRKMLGWIIALAIVAVLGIGGAIGWSRLSKEHNEAKNLPIAAINFSELKDGTYNGKYEGGMYKWRANEVLVTVSGGKVTEIKLLSSTDPAKENMKQDELYGRVIEAQSLKVDALSSATLTSNAYLKAVEDALLKAQK